MEFQDVVNQWMTDPSPLNTDRLRDAIQRLPTYSSDEAITPQVFPLMEMGAWAEARGAILAAMPGNFLSPAAHTALARASMALGDTGVADRERSLARASLVTILNSGAGTEDSPWVVLRISDEYDVVAAMGTRVAEQSVTQPDGRVLDRVTTESGEVLWFEVRNAGRRIAGNPQ